MAFRGAGRGRAATPGIPGLTHDCGSQFLVGATHCAARRCRGYRIASPAVRRPRGTPQHRGWRLRRHLSVRRERGQPVTVRCRCHCTGRGVCLGSSQRPTWSLPARDLAGCAHGAYRRWRASGWQGRVMRASRAEGDVHALGDRALVVAIRCGSPAAVHEFVLRFRPMLALAARRLGLTADEREEIADDVLHDTAIRFTNVTAPIPTGVRGYLLRSLRNRATNARRARERRSRATAGAIDSACNAEPYFEHAVVGCASEHSVRASHGPGWDGLAVAPGLARLATLLNATLSVEERTLVEWLAHHAPQQEIAAWLGIGYDATSKRIRRLRARLQAAALRHAERLNTTERNEVMTFLRRASAVARGDPGPTPARRRARDVTRAP